MATDKANKRKTIKKKNPFLKILGFFVLGLVIGGVVFGILFLSKKNDTSSDAKPEEETVVEENTKKPEEKPKPAKIDFQPEVDSFVSSTSGRKSVLIYDLERNEIVGQYNIDESYGTASLYKLFVVYEGYRRLQLGTWQSDDPVGSTDHTISECLDLAIRESHSPCAETLWGLIGHAELDEIIKNDFNILRSDISHLQSNPQDIADILKIFYKHKDIKDEKLISQMKDSFLNQPATTYNWRQGLPSGFKQANVYNKVGWDYNPSGYWNIYHDAAIVEFPENNRHFVVVVMTNQVAFERIREFGSRLENKFYDSSKY